MYAVSKINPNAINAIADHNARLGVAAETLPHSSVGTAAQTAPSRSTIRPKPSSIRWSCILSLSFDQIIAKRGSAMPLFLTVWAYSNKDFCTSDRREAQP